MRACAVIATLLLTCCTSPHQIVVTDVNATAWRDSTVVVLRNSDTLTRREVRILVRSNTEFVGDTLSLCIATTAPDSVRYAEHFTLVIPRNRYAASVRRQADIPYRFDVVLADTGNYQFVFRPVRSVRGIEAVGIHILNKD
ncbi:MAG: hypothetical protein RR971_04025 [Alistipes sp.]